MSPTDRRAYWKARREAMPKHPRPLVPHGTIGAARRHQRAGEALCGPCASAWREHQHRMYEQRKESQK